MDFEGFEVSEEIGGGAHCFWRARRTSDGRRVLLKASGNGSGSTSNARALLEHEFEVCRDINVDGVIAVLDLIGKNGSAVLVLASVPGAPLEHFLSRHGCALPLNSALKIGAQLASTLSALHRRDLMHRDLRPANVFYDEETGQVLLTGLGRASQVGREAWRLRPPNRLEGDPTYLAPEATGRINRQLDYRADLYSLGVVLFEMLTGRLPFEATDRMALVHAHIAVDAPDPRAYRSAIPTVVSAIVGKLLARAAEERYQSGLGLLYDLERCLAKLADGGEIRPFELGERDVAERFELPQGLFGREVELDWLEQALAAAAAGRGSVRLVAGYSGVGKTSLVEEIRCSVIRRGGLFASGTFDPNSRAMPYAGILTALRSLVEQRLGANPQQAASWGRLLEAELGSNFGVVTEALPELLSLVGEPPPVLEAAPANAMNRFHVSICSFLASLVAVKDSTPLVIFLDDLHWIDPASLALMASLVTGERGAFLLLGAYRDSEVDQDHLLAHTLEHISEQGVDIDSLRLPPLTEAALSRLVSETLHLESSEVAPLARLVYRKTAGNPFFAHTFLSTLHRRGLLRFTVSESSDSFLPSARWTWDLGQITKLEATENVIELIAHRLTELPSAARRAVAVASMLGKEVDVETLAAVCGGDASATPCRERDRPKGSWSKLVGKGFLSTPTPPHGGSQRARVDAMRSFTTGCGKVPTIFSSRRSGSTSTCG